MADQPNAILEAVESFVCEIDRERYVVNAGSTRVSSDNILVKHFPERFRPLELSYGVEEATAEPGRRSRPEGLFGGDSTRPAPREAAASGENKTQETKGLSSQNLRPKKETTTQEG